MLLLLTAIFIIAHNIEGTVINRIIGGRLAGHGEFPMQVSIRRSYNDKHFCGGIIISRNYILSAAHCMFYSWAGSLQPFMISVVVGQNLLKIDHNTIYRNASEVIIHPDFNRWTKENDIALIKLNKELIFDNLVSSAELVKTVGDNKLECLITGWGATNSDSSELSGNLMVTKVVIWDYVNCKKTYKNLGIPIAQSMLCAGALEDTYSDACQGDSGGPLLCDNKIYGIISSGKGCGNRDYPGVYTNVTYFLTWISSHILEEINNL